MKTRVYDLPTRCFHWLFAGSFIAAFTISNTVDDDNLAFSYHMIFGLIMVFSVLLRGIWGIIGSRHARFTDFSLNVSELVAYLKGILTGTNRKWVGHNPASSWAALVMMLLALGLGGVGILMATGVVGESWKEFHELLANTFIVVVILHIAGVILHQLKHKDLIGMSMVTGYKRDLAETTESVSRHFWIGLLFLFLIAGFSAYVVQNFDQSSSTLSVFGTKLQLAENEGNEHKEYEHRESKEHEEYEKDD
jgi:cytochrome b